MKPARDPVIAALDREPAYAARSPLTRWMRANYAELRERFGDREIDWIRLAKLLGKSGVLNRDRKPPTPDAVRKAWQRAGNSVGTAKRPKPATAPVPTAPAPQPPRQPRSLIVPDIEDDPAATWTGTRLKDPPKGST